ncbi:MAG: class A beta-lactamase-related serine hydrolase [Lysobacteraceae bacterium]|nr:MAG: class A beta-lactamase-related serine hydrolase [Xanthomonadaceae bacterium]
MRLKPLVLATALAFALPVGQAAAQATVAPLVVDTPSETADGNPFVAPAEWRLERRGRAIVLTPPEGDSHIVLLDATAKDVDAAVAEAWAAYDPAAKWPLKVANDRPGRDGWEQGRMYQYETSANDKRGVIALAMRNDDKWTIGLYDMTNATGEKRSAQVSKIFDRLLPKGEVRESFAGKQAHKLDAARLQQLAGFIEQLRKDFEVPGVAIGIVQDGKVVMSRGFGARALGKPEAVDGDTRFMIASNTKALTTLMLAKLVESGRFGWDTPATQLLPSFKLGDADTTRQVLVKHLICACTGLPRQDFEWLFEGEKFTAASAVASLAAMQPTSNFGALFQYSNPMAAAAGFIGGHVLHPEMELGAAYDKAMQDLVFDPLGMRNTTFDYARAMQGNFAQPHADDVDYHTVVAGMGINNTIVAARPAGAAWSTVNDVLRYVQMELDGGKLPDGSRYIAEAPLMQRREPQVALGNDGDYAMGLMVDRTYGIQVVDHGGDLDGFHSNMMWLPEYNVGAVILTNSDRGVYLRGPFQRRWLEVLFDGKPEAAENAAAQRKAHRAQFEAERKRLTVPADPVVAKALAVRYRNAELGDVVVSRQGKGVWFDTGGWKSEVVTRRNEDGSMSFVSITPGAGAGFEWVVADGDGKRALVTRDGQHEYRFEEVR